MLKRFLYAWSAFRYAWATYNDKKVAIILEDYELAISGDSNRFQPYK
jgi:hypothetical protein